VAVFIITILFTTFSSSPGLSLCLLEVFCKYLSTDELLILIAILGTGTEE